MRTKNSSSVVERTGMFALALLSAMALVALPGCRKSMSANSANSISQSIETKKTKNDNLRDGMRFLNQLTPSTRKQVSKEVLVQLNTWIDTIPRDKFQYKTPVLYQQPPADWGSRADVKNPAQLFLDEWDVDYLFQCKLMRGLADWVTSMPVRDRMMKPSIDATVAKLESADAAKFEEVYKLFDWTIRNIALEGDAKDVEKLSLDPRGPLKEPPIGCSKLPWEALLFSRGDFVERGRVFTALAHQRGIDTVWISINGNSTSPGYLWAIGVPIGGSLYLFETKLGMPILDPDTLVFATLADARKKERVLRRLDLPGQFEYAVNPGDLESLALLIDALPTALSARMKMLEKSLLGADRMLLTVDSDALTTQLAQVCPNDPVALWQLPLLARDFAAEIREALLRPSPLSSRYIANYGSWLFDTPAAKARLQHLKGNFESNLDEEGALAIYMKTKETLDNESLAKLAYDPDVQKEMGLPKLPNEPNENYAIRIQQAQMLFAQAKVDSAFMLAELHYDRGGFDSARDWLEKRVISDKRAEKWYATAQYLLSRTNLELGQNDKAESGLTYQPTPQEAGNRLRLRILKREK